MKKKSSTSNIYDKVYRRLLCTLLLFLPLLSVSAQETAQASADTVIIVKTLRDTLWMSPLSEIRDIRTDPAPTTGYDRRVRRYRRRWAALIPTHTKLQFAGNMGLLSAGFGWDYGKHNQWETDLLFGFVPKYDSDRAKATFTLKQNYIPWSLQIKQSRFSAEPLTCGLYFNTVFGNEFWTSEPDRYPKGYYGFSSKVRIHVFLGQRLTYDIDPKRRFTAKALTLFYELSTCDLYLISAVTNRYLRPRDYLSLSFGVKVQLL